MSEKYRGHSRSPFESHEPKKLKRDEVMKLKFSRFNINPCFFQESDGDKSDGDLVVDDANEVGINEIHWEEENKKNDIFRMINS